MLLLPRGSFGAIPFIVGTIIRKGHINGNIPDNLYSFAIGVSFKLFPLDAEHILLKLGFLTPSVLELVKRTGYPGMKVLQFAFDSREDSPGQALW